ncbi:DNA-binding protein [Streptosporangium sp. NPDC023615]|uniref:DNA-binding protein n=1 Tax=Streptosporangium sp. NPDC023615 TaxID=3154794 RepID=UPI003434C5C7
MSDANLFTRPDPAVQRARRTYTALMHLAERHADTPERRARQIHPSVPSPHEVVRLVTAMAAGSALAEPGEPEIDTTDLMAALTLVPQARAELDATEAALLKIARGRGMTWQDIAFSLGLSTPQAARQRYERLEARSAPDAEAT